MKHPQLLGDEHLKNISDEYTLGAELGKGKFGVARRGTRKSDQAAVQASKYILRYASSAANGSAWIIGVYARVTP